jgi:hypothetical protein
MGSRGFRTLQPLTAAATAATRVGFLVTVPRPARPDLAREGRNHSELLGLEGRAWQGSKGKKQQQGRAQWRSEMGLALTI